MTIKKLGSVTKDVKGNDAKALENDIEREC